MAGPHPYFDIPMLVLTGVGRSGTTALRKALSEHPQIISSGHEHNVVFDILEVARRNRTEYSRRYAMLISDEAHDAHFRQLILDLIFPDPEPITAGSTLMLFTNLFPATAKYLLQSHPNSQIVCLVRNGIEVIDSRMKHDQFGPQSFNRHCTIWNNAGAMERMCRSSSRCLCIRHEDLVCEPDTVCSNVFDFANIKQYKQVSDHLKNTTYHPTPVAGKARWADWTQDQCEIFNQLCADEMASLGYPIPWHTQSPSAG